MAQNVASSLKSFQRSFGFREAEQDAFSTWELTNQGVLVPPRSVHVTQYWTVSPQASAPTPLGLPIRPLRECVFFQVTLTICHVHAQQEPDNLQGQPVQ